MEYLVRFAQCHESFRLPELHALASLTNVDLEVLTYETDSPFCTIRLASDQAARKLISRSILGVAIYSLWGSGNTYDDLHASVKDRTSHLWPDYRSVPFNFQVDSFRGRRSNSQKNAIIDAFAYLQLAGPIEMRNPHSSFTVSEEHTLRGAGVPAQPPRRVFFGRFLAESSRAAADVYNLKKRLYISTTSMDAELSLVTANMALAGEGKLHYDPFMGTGSFPLSCAHFGSTVLGSDIDGRSIRGAGKLQKHGRSVVGNFKQYGLSPLYLDGFTSDLTNCPLRAPKRGRYLDGIVCDPPYGVREGLKVLGSTREDLKQEIYLKDGRVAHTAEGYIPPKQAYSFEAMLHDILDFAFAMLVDNGRLCMWMPTANDEEVTLAIPSHPGLELAFVSVQDFSKWSRRLLTYRRLVNAEVDEAAVQLRQVERKDVELGGTASELNAFRKRFFEGFKAIPDLSETSILHSDPAPEV